MSRKTNISYPLIRTRAGAYRNGGKKCSFFGKFDMLCFLATSVLRFGLLPYYWRITVIVKELLLIFMQIANFEIDLFFDDISL